MFQPWLYHYTSLGTMLLCAIDLGLVDVLYYYLTGKGSVRSVQRHSAKRSLTCPLWGWNWVDKNLHRRKGLSSFQSSITYVQNKMHRNINTLRHYIAAKSIEQQLPCHVLYSIECLTKFPWNTYTNRVQWMRQIPIVVCLLMRDYKVGLKYKLHDLG